MSLCMLDCVGPAFFCCPKLVLIVMGCAVLLGAILAFFGVGRKPKKKRRKDGN